MLKILRPVSLLEAASFLLLLILTVVKYAASAPLGVQILGPVHGVLFIVYVLTAIGGKDEAGWSLKTLLLVLLGSVLPFGGFVVHQKFLTSPATA